MQYLLSYKQLCLQNAFGIVQSLLTFCFMITNIKIFPDLNWPHLFSGTLGSVCSSWLQRLSSPPSCPSVPRTSQSWYELSLFVAF